MKKRILLFGLLAIMLIALFLGTNPQQLPSVFLVMPFLVIFSALFWGAKWFILRRYSNIRKANRIAVLCASLPTLLLVLQSLGQLTIKDVGITTVLFILSYFYIARNMATE